MGALDQTFTVISFNGEYLVDLLNRSSFAEDKTRENSWGINTQVSMVQFTSSPNNKASTMDLHKNVIDEIFCREK